MIPFEYILFYFLCLHIRTTRMCQHKTGILWFRYRFVELGQGFLNKNKQENVNFVKKTAKNDRLIKIMEKACVRPI